MRIKFQTTLEEELIRYLKLKAIDQKCDVNDILEKLIEEMKNNEK